MPRTKKALQSTDFKALFKLLKDAVDANEVLRNDALLAQQLRDFERMAEMNDTLWQSINEEGYSYIDPRSGRPQMNPAIGTFNKNQTTLLKTAQWIEEKTKAITLNDDKKSW